MKLILLVGGFLVLAMAGFFVFSSTKPQIQTVPPSSQSTQTNGHANDETNIKAGFAIFTNGTFRIFTDPRYHNLSPDVYIESSNPNVVHVRTEGITWDDFFKALPMKLTRDCLTTGTGQTFCSSSNQTLKFYINGELDSNALDRIINQGDKLLVSFGSENDQQIQNQLQQIP